MKANLRQNEEDLIAQKAENEILTERLNSRQQLSEEIQRLLNIAEKKSIEYEMKINDLTEQNNTLKNTSPKYKNALTELQSNLKEFKEKSENEKQILKNNLTEINLLQNKLIIEKDRLERELLDSQQQIQTLREQVRPIGYA